MKQVIVCLYLIKKTWVYVFSCKMLEKQDWITKLTLQKYYANIVCLDAFWFDISSETAFQKVPQI